MKTVVLLFFSFFIYFNIYAQGNYVNWTKKEITDTFRIKSPEWKYDTATSSKGLSMIVYSNLTNFKSTDFYGATYYFDDNNNCVETALFFDSKYLVTEIEMLNTICIKGEPLEWVDKKGTQIYKIVSKGNFFVLHIYLLN